VGGHWSQRYQAEFVEVVRGLFVPGKSLPGSLRRDIHPTNEDPFAGTPNLGQPQFGFMECVSVGTQTCSWIHESLRALLF
jgi:hypothetical protein